MHWTIRLLKRLRLLSAHNEENVIGHMVESLRLLDYPNHLYDIFVIADNCTDNTAQAAAKPEPGCTKGLTMKTGKGFALIGYLKNI